MNGANLLGSAPSLTCVILNESSPALVPCISSSFVWRVRDASNLESIHRFRLVQTLIRAETIEVVSLDDDAASKGFDSDDHLVEMVWQLRDGSR
jgi:hypothetical protein